MPNTLHSLAVDLPEYKQAIHDLRQSDSHFARLLALYEELTHQIESMEKGVTPAADETEHSLKSKRVHIKDDLVRILEDHKKSCCSCGKCACAKQDA